MKNRTTRSVKFCAALICCIVLCACSATQAITETLPSEDPSAIYDRARGLETTGSSSQAYDMYLGIYKNYPRHAKAAEALYAAALIADRTNPQRAIDLYEKYLADYPKAVQSAGISDRLFLDYMNMGNYSKAAALFGSIYATSPDKKWTNRGLDLIETLRKQKMPEALLKVLASVYPNTAGNTSQRLISLWEGELENISSPETLSALEKQVTNPDLLELLLAREAKVYQASKNDGIARKVMGRLGGLGSRADENGPPIKNSIGVILPLSGKWEAVGQKILNGVEMASGVFAAGKPSGIEYIIRDYGSDPGLIPQIIDEMDSNGNILAVIGPVGEAAGSIAARVLQEKGIPGIMFNRSELPPQEESFAFNNFVSIETEARTLLDVAANRNIKRFAILYPDDNFGNLFTAAFTSMAPGFGINVVKKVAYSQRNVDFKQEIATLAAGAVATTDRAGRPVKIPNFEGLLVPDSAINAAMVASYLAYSSIEGVTLFGPTLWDSPDLLRVGEHHVNGAVFMSGLFLKSRLDFVREFNDAFYYTFGYNPSVWEACAYDTAAILQNLLTGEALTRESLRQRLGTIEDYPGVTGGTTFHPDGTSHKNIFVLTVSGRNVIETTVP